MVAVYDTVNFIGFMFINAGRGEGNLYLFSQRKECIPHFKHMCSKKKKKFKHPMFVQLVFRLNNNSRRVDVRGTSLSVTSAAASTDAT